MSPALLKPTAVPHLLLDRVACPVPKPTPEETVGVRLKEDRNKWRVIAITLKSFVQLKSYSVVSVTQGSGRFRASLFP